jgi:hypothetical protein
MRIERTLLGACGALLLAAASGASPFNPLVDFRVGAPFTPTGPTAVWSASWGGYQMTFEAMALDGVGGLTPDGRLYWDGEDGFGIRGQGHEDDEIENPEVLRIRFDQTTFIERFLLTDLFVEGTQAWSERGYYSLNGTGSWTPFFANGWFANGEVELAIDSYVSTILFTSPGRTQRGHHEFAVAGFDGRPGPASAPEPGGALLFGSGLALLSARVRRGLRAPAARRPARAATPSPA